MKAVTHLESNADRIKVGDGGSSIKFTLTNIENDQVNAIRWVRLTKDFKSYIGVTDVEYVNNVVTIRLPPATVGEYVLEIMDVAGRIYPAGNPIIIDIIRSTEGGKQAVFVDYREEIIGELPAIVAAHMDANTEAYQGPQGPPGETLVNPPKTYTRAEYDALSTYDTNTLYIVKEA